MPEEVDLKSIILEDKKTAKRFEDLFGKKQLQ
jgi:hypothetical protein